MTAPDLTRNARRVLEARYLRRDEDGKVVETPEELFRRVAKAIAEAELRLHGPDEARRWEERFLERLLALDFLPNSPTLMNAGTELGQLSGCYVLPVPDAMDGIFDALKQMALVQQSGGGTGFAFSRLRPRGGLVHSTGGESSGPVAFMRIFDCATDGIKQGGKRRGANMGVLRVDHPDIEEFIDLKREPGILENFNISVAATDAFMEAAAAGRSYALRDPRDGAPVGERDAAGILEKTAAAAWATGDPGLFFIDTANRAHPMREAGEIESTNPCGEIPLLPYESCNLGSINVSRFVRGEGEEADTDWDDLALMTRTAVRFLDDVIEVNVYPIPETEETTRRNRKIGLGIMGFAEALVKLGIPYDSDRAEAYAGELMGFVAETAVEASEALARERGVFPGWDESIHRERGLRVRNATRTAIAPTGTIGIIAGTSPSIEPFFSLAYRRTNVLSGETLRTVNPLLEEWAERYGVDVDAVMREVRRAGTLEGVEGIPGEMRELFATAGEIAPGRHLRIQAGFQRHVDNAVSKTVNLPEEATEEDVAEIYRRAWELGCKGITVFRYGSKGSQVLERGEGEETGRSPGQW